MSRKIDYDRPTIIRIINRLNMEVFMYKDQPGVYYSAHGHELPLDLAQEAGYDVVKLEKLKNKKLRLEQAAALIEQEEGLNTVGRVALYENQGFRAVALGNGLHIVEDEDGTNLTPATRLSYDQAKKLTDQLAEGKIKTEAKAIAKSAGGPVLSGDVGGGSVRGAEMDTGHPSRGGGKFAPKVKD